MSEEQPLKRVGTSRSPHDPPSGSRDGMPSQGTSPAERCRSPVASPCPSVSKFSRKKRSSYQAVVTKAGKHHHAEACQPKDHAWPLAQVKSEPSSGREHAARAGHSSASRQQKPEAPGSFSSMASSPTSSPSLPLAWDALPDVNIQGGGSAPDETLSESLPDTSTQAAEKRLAQAVLKGLQLPLSPDELPRSPMVKREPPMRGRCVSLHLVPTIDIISQPTASVTPESAAATLAPTSTPSVSPALGVSATETGNGGRGKRPPRSQAPRDTERHAVVYPPVLKVRSSISFAEMQRAMMEHLNAVYGEGLAEDRSDEQEADDAFSQERSPRRRSFISRRFPSIIRNRIRAQGPKSQDSMSSQGKKQPASSSSERASPHVASKGRDSSRVLGCVVCTSALLVTALLLWVAHERRTMPSVAKDELYLCDTEDCVEHARSILRSLSPKSNPCYCFYSYVCGGGGRQTAPPARKAGNFRRDASHKARPNRLARAYAQYISTFGSAQDMFSPKMALPAAAKASVALATCLTRTDEERPSQLVEFMKARKLRWPTMADDAGSVDVSGVLDILVDLSVNWKVSLWFDVSGWNTRAPGGPEVPIIVLGEPGHVPLLRMEHISRLDVSTYTSALREVAYFLATDDGIGDGGETVKPLNDASVLEELRQDETSLREALLSALGDGGVYDALISPNETGSLLRGVSDAEWTSLLRKHMGPVTESRALFFVRNRRQFTELSDVTERIPAHRLLNALGWMFAYCYGWIVNSTFDDFRGPARLSDVNSEGVEDDLSTYLLCFLAMEESFGIAPLAPRFARDFAPEDRGKIAAIFNATTHQLTATVQASLAISNATKLAAINKILEHTDEELWPPEPFQNLRLLDSLYAGFPSKTAGGNFYSFWFESRRALRAALRERYYETLMTAKLRWYAEEILYAYSLNDMTVGLAALFPPTYFRGGSAVMAYAGLGFLLSRQLIKAIDERGRQVDHRTGKTSSWWEEHQECRIGKAHTAKEKRLLGDLFALDLALAAMKNVSEGYSSPLRLKFLEKLTPVQTFYVSYCSRFCGELGAREVCNVAMNGSDFRNAFDCQWRPIDRGCIFV